jgi:uncharacterized membrane protein
MKSKTGWILAIVLGLVILFLLPSLLMGRFWLGGFNGMMGPGMMGGFGYQNPLGFFGMTLMWLIPLGVLVLLVIGAVALVNGLIRPGNLTPVVSERKCSNCGKPVQTDWATCPYCGKSLR